MDLHIDKKPRLECSPVEEEYPDSLLEDEALLQDVQADIALEIGLRERLLTTAEGRIEWATLLCKALESEDSVKSGETPTMDFKAIALQALSAVEAPIDILISRDVPAPPIQQPAQRKKPTLRKKTVKFAYIYLNKNAAPSILRCPLCFRTDFTALQELLDHAREMHSLGWTTHEECIRHCTCSQETVGEEFMDLELGAEVSVDVRSMAPVPRPLGLHVQVPVGRARGIMVWDPDAEVDIDSVGETPKRGWRMPFNPRNIFQPTDASALPAPAAASSTRFNPPTRVTIADRSLWLPPATRTGSDTHKWMISVDAPPSARHITTILECLSVEGPAGRVSTTAPPFAVIGTASEPFIARISLQMANQENGTPQRILLEHWVELDRMESKSVAFGEEHTVDVSLDRTTVFLPQRSGYIPTYSRALWDMELDPDRRTPLELASTLPTTDHSPVSPINSKNRMRNPLPRIKMLGTWENALRTLLERFPLTLQDAKGGKPPVPPLPYRLVATVKTFSNLVMGRRKAIEWGRAAAMCSAYTESLNAGLTEDITALTTADVYAWLHTNGHFPISAAAAKQEQQTTSDFCPVCGLSWRIHAAIFDPGMHTMVSFGGNHDCQIITSEWRVAKKPMVDVQRILARKSGPTSPATDKSPVDAQPPTPSVALARNANWDSRRALMASAASPALVAAIRAQITRLGLRTFPAPPSTTDTTNNLPRFPVPTSLPTPSDVQEDLAPFAMLALITKPFIRALIHTALAVSLQDNLLARQKTQVDARLRAGRYPALANLFTGESGKRMLMPSHLLRGIVGRSWDWNDQLGMAVMGVVARSGVQLEGSAVVTPGVGMGMGVGAAGAAARQAPAPAPVRPQQQQQHQHTQFVITRPGPGGAVPVMSTAPKPAPQGQPATMSYFHVGQAQSQQQTMTVRMAANAASAYTGRVPGIKAVGQQPQPATPNSNPIVFAPVDSTLTLSEQGRAATKKGTTKTKAKE
ncbi:hypothetical protein MKEN_00768200 [Mycena kentingensis (nom. inval.)]|nr:hypothetical protein MKEN_00768200 [Mycena kentingensis (nom. inval.)]